MATRADVIRETGKLTGCFPYLELQGQRWGVEMVGGGRVRRLERNSSQDKKRRRGPKPKW